MIAIALMTSWLASTAGAAVPADVDSAAMEQLKEVDAAAPDQARKPEQAKDGGSLGFTIQSLKPIGYRTSEGATVTPGQAAPQVPAQPDEQPLPAKPAPAAETAQQEPKPQTQGGAGKCYTFNGNSPMKGVTIYTPKEDATCTQRTEEPPPKEGPISKKMVYGALGLGAAAVAAGFLLWPPALLIGGLLLGAGAVLWYINKKLS